MRTGRERVLLFAADAQVRVVALGRLAHRHVVERIGQPVVRHRVEQLDRAELEAGRDFGSRCGALVIDSMPPATTVSNSPALISWSASAIASSPDRQTLLIVSAGTRHRDPGGHRGLAGRNLAGAGLQHLAHDHVVDVAALSAGPLERRADRDAAELRPPTDRVRPPRSLPIGVRAPDTITEPLPSAMVATSVFSTRLFYRSGYSVLPRREGTPVLLSRIDHVGIAVTNLEEAIERYRSAFGLEVAATETNDLQGVREAMLRVGPSVLDD